MALPAKIYRSATKFIMSAAIASGGKLITTIADCCCGGTSVTKTCWYQFGFACSTGTVFLAQTLCLTDAEATAMGLNDGMTETWDYSGGYAYWRKGADCTVDECAGPGDPPGWPSDLSHCDKYRVVKRCDTDEVVNIGVIPTVADTEILPYTTAFKIIIDGLPLDDVCYYMDGSETIIEPAIIVTGDVSDHIPGAYEAGWAGNGFSGDGGWSICRECLGTAVRCDGPTTVHVAWYRTSDNLLLCEADLTSDGPCTWSNTTSCGGIDFTIGSLYWNGSAWEIQGYDSTFSPAGVPWTNDTTDSTILPLGTYLSSDTYMVVSLP